MEPNRTKAIRPFLRWAGSKRRLVDRIREQIPNDCERYVEPFSGSACVFFSAIRGNAILADFNTELVHAFNVVKKHPRLLARSLAKLSPDPKTYYQIREQQNFGGTDLQRATRFIFLNAHCFNGVYRTNRNGRFNVPMGTKTAGVPTEKHLVQCSIALRHASVLCQSYLDTLESCGEGDFVYLDPPYPKPGSRNRGEYGIGSFAPEDEEDLIKSLKSLDRQSTKFLLSYKASSSFLKTIPSSFLVRRVYVQRSVAGFAEARNRVAEVFVRNYGIKDHKARRYRSGE